MRGVLDMCVLSLLRDQPLHAYGVVERLQAQGFDNASYGTIYPLTTRLRKQGLVEQQLVPSSSGPARTMLSLNEHGRTALADWIGQWETITARAAALITGHATATGRTTHVG